MENRYMSEKLKSLEEKLLRRIHSNKVPFYEFKQCIIKSETYCPVFFLSTGRTGTKFFTELLRESKNNVVFHSLEPELIEQGKRVYEAYNNNALEDNFTPTLDELVGQMFLSARENVLYREFIRNKRYIETNNRITFFAPGLKKVFPNAKFVFLHRHPGEFIRSGLRRDWYGGNQSHDIGRIVPMEGSELANKWSHFSKEEKIAWLWNETNDFIDHFLSGLPEDDYLTFNFNDLSFQNVKNLLDFLNVEGIPDNKVKELIPKKINAQSDGDVDVYEHWSKEKKAKVEDICGDLANKLGHTL